MAPILSLIGVALFLIASLWIVVIFPAKIFIRVIKTETGFARVIWIILMLLMWPMTNFIYGIWKSEKKSDKILCAVFLVISFCASIYVYKHFDQYMDQLTASLPAQS